MPAHWAIFNFRSITPKMFRLSSPATLRCTLIPILLNHASGEWRWTLTGFTPRHEKPNSILSFFLPETIALISRTESSDWLLIPNQELCISSLWPPTGKCAANSSRRKDNRNFWRERLPVEWTADPKGWPKFFYEVSWGRDVLQRKKFPRRNLNPGHFEPSSDSRPIKSPKK